MGIVKSIQYSIFCENYYIQENHELSCNNFEDFKDLDALYMMHKKKRTPQQHFKKLGYRKIDSKWYCPDCVAKMKSNQLKQPIK